MKKGVEDDMEALLSFWRVSSTADSGGGAGKCMILARKLGRRGRGMKRGERMAEIKKAGHKENERCTRRGKQSKNQFFSPLSI